MNPTLFLRRTMACLLGLGLATCTDDLNGPADPPQEAAALVANGSAPPAPPGLMNVSFGGADLDIWPWTGHGFEGQSADPLNLVFTGNADVVWLRAALRALNGDRSAYGFPNVPPFNCTWTDAHGEMQSAYSEGAGWVANAVQLQCGSYQPVRFHLRLFDAGPWVIAGTHFDLLIPNTPQHQVINWERAEQFVLVDFLRSGLLNPAAPFGFAPLGAAGSVQAIPVPIYNGMPDALKVAFGLPPGPGAVPVPVPTNGLATILNLGTRAPAAADLVESEINVPFNQVIPRPFCSVGPLDYVRLVGPVYVSVSTRVNDAGMLESHNTLRGDLDVTPIDVTTGLPSGPAFRAQISQIDNTGVGPNGTHVNAVQLRKALPPGVGALEVHMLTGPNGAAQYTVREKCN
jgi:hypothetical protein